MQQLITDFDRVWNRHSERTNELAKSKRSGAHAVYETNDAFLIQRGKKANNRAIEESIKSNKLDVSRKKT